ELEFSPDGRWLALRTDNGEPGAGDILGIRTSGDTTPIPLAASPFAELHPAFSPDGQWLAYTSSEGGNPEVFVRSMADGASGRWQVSTGGGAQPRWSPDGRELYYFNIATGEVSAARLRTQPDFDVVDRRALFRATSAIADPFHQSYDVLRDGSGFVTIHARDEGRAAPLPPLVLGEHWFTELDARAAR
ncbi:MAG TPA: hypothetical protein VFX50_01445, partial [Gemmatimonadales bacterium]|nr:hypothetical protein [Gemmatimonadales bacterium]